jgi:hypothetical protein
MLDRWDVRHTGHSWYQRRLRPMAVEDAKVPCVRRRHRFDELSLAVEDRDRAVEPDVDFDHLAGIGEPPRRGLPPLDDVRHESSRGDP